MTDNTDALTPCCQDIRVYPFQRDLQFSRESEHDIYYKNLPTAIGQRRVDFVVEGKVLVELEAITKLKRCIGRKP